MIQKELAFRRERSAKFLTEAQVEGWIGMRLPLFFLAAQSRSSNTRPISPVGPGTMSQVSRRKDKNRAKYNLIT